MIRAAVDLGTNTCLLLIAELDERHMGAERIHPVSDHSTIVRLGQGVDQDRKLRPEAMDRALQCLKEYAQKVRKQGIDPREAVCVATSQARDAANGAEFFAKVESETGFRFRVISGEEEARLTFLGALLPGMRPEASAVIDIGGGSTELISASGGKSLDIGSVRFTERFLKSDPVIDEEFWACQDAIDSALNSLQQWRSGLSEETELVAVAGTATTLAAYFLGLKQFNAAEIDGVELTRGDIHRMVEELKWRTVRERSALSGIDPGRADVILAGALILWRAMELLNFRSCRVSTRGLRFGVISDRAPQDPVSASGQAPGRAEPVA